MDTQRLSDLVDQLDDDIDELEERLEPLLSTAFSATTKKLPVLDRAKLYVLVTYTIESLLFSYIRLHGENAKEHPVFKELSRVRLYFEKLKNAESGGSSKRDGLALDKEAAGRIIKHGLAGNEKYDLERAEKQAREKLLAQKRLQQSTSGKKRPADTEEVEAETPQSGDVSTTSEGNAAQQKSVSREKKRDKKKKKSKHSKSKSDTDG